MVFYPEDAGCSLAWYGEKWIKMAPNNVLTPMAKHPESGCHFYVGELVKCVDGTWFLLEHWFRKKGCGPEAVM
jgi:hypothetical protein